MRQRHPTGTVRDRCKGGTTHPDGKVGPDGIGKPNCWMCFTDVDAKRITQQDAVAEPQAGPHKLAS
ncbi:MAG: hypothetical protein WCP28_14200 [Actinomycetes bacterium]